MVAVAVVCGRKRRPKRRLDHSRSRVGRPVLSWSSPAWRQTRDPAAWRWHPQPHRGPHPGAFFPGHYRCGCVVDGVTPAECVQPTHAGGRAEAAGAVELWPQEQQLCAKAAEGGLLDLRSRRRRGRTTRLEGGSGARSADPGAGAVPAAHRARPGAGRPSGGGAAAGGADRGPAEPGRLEAALSAGAEPMPPAPPARSGQGGGPEPQPARQLPAVPTVRPAIAGGPHAQPLDWIPLRRRGRASAEPTSSGQLDCSEAVFSDPDGLRLERLWAGRRRRYVSCTRSQCTGEVRLPGAHIEGQLDCSEAVFSNPDGAARDADGLTVDAGMFLRKAQCTGEVLLFGAHIGAS